MIDTTIKSIFSTCIYKRIYKGEIENNYISYVTQRCLNMYINLNVYINLYLYMYLYMYINKNI